MADNSRFDLTGVPLKTCLEIALDSAPGGKIVAWRVNVDENEKRKLVLYWSGTDRTSGLPAPLELGAAVEFVKSWLLFTDYGPEEDTDGHCKKGFRVYNEHWGHVDNDPYAFAAIEPVWLVYGK